MKKKKKISRPAIIIITVIVLVIALVVGVWVATGDGDATVEDPIVPIYMVYGIKGETTTDSAIRAVELSMNRVLISRYNIAIDLFLYTEDEYEQAVADAFAATEAFLNKTATSTDTSEATEYPRMTEDYIIDTLAADKDLVHAEPSIDILLCKDFASYNDYVNKGLLNAIDDKLSSEAEVLKEYIYATLLNVAKIGGKTYGVPNNKPIGEYQFVVFDKELLEKYKVDAATMKTLTDIEAYLKLIKENEPDVIPLLNAVDTTELTYMFGQGSAVSVSPYGEVISTYSSPDFADHQAIIAKYRTLGYLPSAEEAKETDKRFAVTFVSGNATTVATLSKKTGYEYSYNVYAYPSATAENTISSLFALSKYCISSDATAAINFLVAINTDEQIKNYFLYGNVNENYMFNDEGQVEMLNDTYSMKNDYTGNTYLAYTLAGTDPNYAENSKKQNLDSVTSKLFGYTYAPTVIKGKNTDENGNKLQINELDYMAVLNSVSDKYYAQFMDGSFGYIEDLEAFYAEALVNIKTKITSNVRDEYITAMKNEYKANFLASKKADAAYLADLLAKAQGEVDADIKKAVTASLKTKLTEEVKVELGEGATQEDIDAKVAERLTDDLINKTVSETYTADDIAKLVEAKQATLLETAAKDALSAYIITDAYANAVAAIDSDAKFLADVEARFEASKEAELDKELLSAILEKIESKCYQITNEFDSVIKSELQKFYKEQSAVLGLSEEDIKDKISINSFNEVVINRFAAQYYKVYPME